MLLVIAGVLALASACRYYYVITLGERVVADLRNAVFTHVTELSPAFFDTAQSGEIVSRLAADTTQIKVGGRRHRVGRAAQRHHGARRRRA